ncbi:P-loop containing nucleoside triphosphate hydrolase protein [Tuber magnatum]|uniref:P-loop containing nucleoside triphosphate hydrolase protein n=1 Tax=Tuber magnatum TaxID=42249 RepID=A0A317SLR3_9PEZI|nr:P-loop containing nucleoside triphosphate hydrolase protein [Tuber magnatum]
MVLAESKNRVGLGRALMNSRSGSSHKTNSKHGDGFGVVRDGESDALYTTEKHEADWYRMRSITQQNEFLNTAELADTDFTAEKVAKTKHRQNKQQLTVPRRPHWDSTTTPAELERHEKDSLMHWCRGLAELQEAKALLMTPFERNLEVWRGDLVVQIVHARNPLMFRCEDLERYIKERSAWADCFEKEGIKYQFFSAALAKQTNEEYYSVDEEEEPTRIGLVGYPNVGNVENHRGKSSTINALIGAKKVSVSSTPGKTKHFQTLHLGEKIVLYDCPGLIFPNFATTKAELVCNGVLPIDQLREFSDPTTLVAQWIPQQFLRSLYGIKIRTRPCEEGGTGVLTGEELLMAPPIGPSNSHKDPYNEAYLPQNRRAGAYLGQDHDDDLACEDLPIAEMGENSHDLDGKFFAEGRGSLGHMKTPFYLGAGAAGALPGGKHLSGRKARTMISLDSNLSPDEVRKAMGGKKHFKGRKNIK